jgi:nicotinate-nucleotide pyrophosphorylase (carboxylating)
MKEIVIRNLIEQALIEDMPYGDVTTDNLISDTSITNAYLLAKATGVLAGLKYFKQVFSLVDSEMTFKDFKKDGDTLSEEDIILEITGKTKAILKAERLALNILQRMSGIATLTKEFVAKTKNTKTNIVDTRKTTPNFRLFEKEAVVIGGGINHRGNLSETVLIKDNHIFESGGVKNAINIIRTKIPHTMKIEVEVEDLLMFEEALEARADIIMLDNMSTEMMKTAVKLNNNQAILEASGNMSLQRIEAVAECGVDIISVGALTHSYQALDISLRFKK